MTPIHVVLFTCAIFTVASAGVSLWAEPRLPVVWVVPLAAMAYIFLVALVGVPTIGCLLIFKRSALAYVLIVAVLGSLAFGAVGAANGATLAAAGVGALVYGVTALWVVLGCDMGTNVSCSGRSVGGGAADTRR